MDKELFKRILSSIVLIPVVIFFIVKGSLLFLLLIAICFVIVIYEWNKLSKKKPYNILGITFILLSFFSIYKLRNDFNNDYFYFLFVITICVTTDIGGYVFGKLVKGPKLTKISPNKTYSGAIGGYFLSIVSSIFLLNNKNLNTQIEINLDIFIFVFLISTISQIGDILISYFKRLSKIKDTGNIIPGHGGLLDRVDGMIFAFPFAYIIILINIFDIP